MRQAAPTCPHGAAAILRSCQAAAALTPHDYVIQPATQHSTAHRSSLEYYKFNASFYWLLFALPSAPRASPSR